MKIIILLPIIILISCQHSRKNTVDKYGVIEHQVNSREYVVENKEELDEIKEIALKDYKKAGLVVCKRNGYKNFKSLRHHGEIININEKRQLIVSGTGECSIKVKEDLRLGNFDIIKKNITNGL